MRRALLIAGALCLAGGITLSGVAAGQAGAPVTPKAAVSVPKHGAVETAPATTTSKLVTPKHRAAVPNSADKLVIPTVDLNTPLETMPGAVSIDPPGSHSAYRVTGSGYGDLSASSSTSFVVMHASYDPGDRSIPGNHLYDATAQHPKLKPGAPIYADGHQFQVTHVAIIPKSELPSTRAVWDGSSDLVLITCAEAPGATTPATSNVVVFAERI